MLLNTLATLIGIGLHAQWTVYTDHQLDRQIAALRDAGEPVLVEDFNRARSARDGKAAAKLEAVLAGMRGRPSEAMAALDKGDQAVPPLTDEEVQDIRQAERDRAAVLEAIREAATAKSVATTRPVTSPVLQMNYPFLSPAREAANLLRYQAYLRAHDGDSAAALASAAELEPLADLLESEEALINWLVATGVRAVQADLLIRLAPTLTIGAQPKAVSPQVVAGQIATLLDASDIDRSLARAMRFERMLQLDAISTIGRPPAAGRPVRNLAVPLSAKTPLQRYAMQPLLNTNAMACLDLMQGYVAYADAAGDPARQRGIAPWNAEHRLQQMRQSPTTLIAAILAPSLERPFQSRHLLQTRREAAAAALAVRLYAADHAGKLPPKLDDLVPKYMPRLPLDYLTDGQPLHYRADSDQPILWGVGENRRDDGGTEADPNLSARERRETSDDVFPLYVKPREPAM